MSRTPDKRNAEGYKHLAVAQPWNAGLLDGLGRLALSATRLRRTVLDVQNGARRAAHLRAASPSSERTLGESRRRLRIYAVAELPAGGLQDDVVGWCEGQAIVAHAAMAAALTRAEVAQARPTDEGGQAAATGSCARPLRCFWRQRTASRRCGWPPDDVVPARARSSWSHGYSST